jgi:phage shock protein PspC (stress-responsive transcriptional regulator)
MKKLYLSTDKKLSGVCAGVAEYYGVDPTIIRLAYLVLTIVTGVIPGIVAYVVAVAIIPERPRATSKKKK